MAYGSYSTISDASPRDDITRTLLALADPPPGGIHQPLGGIPPAQAQQPMSGGATPTGGMGQQAAPPPGAQMPFTQPAAIGGAAAPTGPMGPISGPYNPLVRLPGVHL